MIHELCPVRTVEQVGENVHVLTFVSARIASSTLPGQFVNIKTCEGSDALLRRPFSVYHCDGDEVQIIFNVVGKGTEALRRKRNGETIDMLGPLGIPFTVAAAGYETAVLIAGGLGVAPFPMLTKVLRQRGKPIVTVLGARTSSMVVVRHLDHVHVATDDGSAGFHGNVVDLLKQLMSERQLPRPKLFACGPTPMLRALQVLSTSMNLPCEASLEGPMGCGFGICQGCPVELTGSEKKYALMCKDGPTFDISRIKFQ